MKKRLLAVFMVLAMLFGMIPVTAFAAEEPHNYVGNGSFEEAGALWNYPSQWPNAELITGDAEGAADGSNYVKLTCTGTQTQLGAVALALVPGATFRFSAQVKGTVEEGTLVVDLRHYGNGGAPLTASWGVYDLVVASADEWNTVSVDVVLPEGIGTNTTGGTEIRIGFKNGTGKGVVYVDDVRFYEVVEEPDEPVYGPIGENLITNGSFENLDADGKPMGVGANNGDKTFGGANGTHTIVSDTDKVYDGTKAAYIYDTAGQTLRLVMNAPAVEAGKSYQFSFWAKGNTESPWTAGNYYKLGAALDYQSDGMTLIDIPAEYAMELKDDEWHQLTYVFEAAETGSLAFYIGCGWAPWIAAVDGVALYEYGEIDPDAPVVDTAALEAAIAAAEALAEEDYTAETWSAMQTALTAAKAALESEVQDDIDAAATALNNAVAALEDAPVYGPIGENLITNGSFENLDADGKPMGVGANNGDKTFGGANGTHTIVSDTDKVYDGTKAAYIYDTAGQTLRLVMNAPAVEAGKSYQFSFWAKGNTESPWVAGNYYKLGAALDYQSDGMSFVDIPAEYAMELKDDEWHQLTYVFEAAETGSLAFYIGCGWAPWIAAVDGVALYEYGEIDPDAPVVDTAALEAAIAAAEALAEEDYTAETWSAMQTALTAAKAALESTVQDDIDAAATALNNAVAALEKAFEPIPVGLVNPDFESNPSELVVPGWEASGFGAWAAGAVCTTYSGNWHITNQSLVVGKGAWVSQKVENLVPGATYKLTANMLSRFAANNVTLEMDMLDADGNVVKNETLNVPFAADLTTEAFELEATLPANCTAVVIKVTNAEESSSWCIVDDFTLTQMTEGNPVEGEPEDPEEPEEFEPVVLDLINPSFEEPFTYGLTKGWTYPDWNATFISRVDEQASHGTYSAKLNYDGSLGAREIYLTHPLKNAVPGGTYKITVDVRGSLEKLVDSADDAVGLSYDPNNGVDGMKWSVGKVVAKDDEWQTIEATITLPAGSTKPVLRVGYYNVKGTVYVDNLTVTLLDIPEGYEPPAEFEPIEVELENGSFEHTTANGSQAKGWKPSDGGNNSAVTLVTGGAYDGDISCKLTSTYGRHTYNDYKVKGLIPGATYKISYATKGSLTYNVEGAAEPATNMGLDILPYDYNDVWVEGAKIMGIGGIKVTDEWQIHEGEITLPQGCTRIVIRPGIANWVGSVYIDDFKLTLVEVPEGVDPTAPTEPVEDDEPKFNPEDSVDGIQMVYNPSFEILDTASGEAASYTYLIQAGDENSYITVNTDPEKSRTGNNSIHLFNDGPGALVAPYTAYRIPLTKGATYVISYWVKGEVTADVFPYTIMWFGTNADGDLATTVESETTKISADPARWQNVLVTFKAPADRDYVTIGAGFAWGTGDLYIDDLEMYLAEMPGGESVDGKQWMFNGDFELVTDGVTDGHTYTGNVSVETEEVYEGNNALKMTGSDDAYVTMPVRDLVSGSAYAVSFWYKGELTDGSISMTTDLYRENDVSDATDNYRGTINVGAVIPSDEWQQYTGVISIPSNAAYGEFKLGFTEGSGTIYVDDVQLLLVSAPTLARMLPDQVYYYTGEYETGKAVTTFNESYHAANTIEIDYQLIDTDNGTVLAEQKNVPIVDDKAVFEFDMDLLTQKQYGYTVKAIIRNKGSELPRSILTDKVYVWDRPLALNENGEFLEGDFVDGEYVPNGEIFTPVIGFEVPGTCGRESGKLLQQGELLDKLLEGGINTILYYIPGGDEQTGFANAKKELDFLAEKGMKALILMYWGMEPSAAPNNVNRIPAAVEALKEHPAIYAWYTADEPFSHDKDGDRVRQQLIDSYKLIRAIDPVHPIYYTEDNAPRYAEADHYADIVSIDPYSGAAEDYETRVGDRSAQLVEETDNARPMNNILQAFTFAGSKPTDIQFRNMIYAAYLGGSRTLGYWCIRDRDVDAVIYERDLWPIITEFNDNEYDIIREQYADGQGEFVAQSRGDNAWYDIWEVDGEYYMIITNRTKKDTTAEVEFDGDITALELVTKYKVDGVVLTETEDGFTVELPASQGVMVKITAVADDDNNDDNDDEDDTNEFEPEGKPGKKPFDGVVIIIGAGEDKENVGTGDSPARVLASLAGFAAVAAGALVVSDKKFRTK